MLCKITVVMDRYKQTLQPEFVQIFVYIPIPNLIEIVSNFGHKSYVYITSPSCTRFMHLIQSTDHTLPCNLFKIQPSLKTIKT